MSKCEVNIFRGVLYGSVVKCLTCNLGTLGSTHTGSSGTSMGVSLGKTLHSHSLVLGKPKKDMINLSCHRDMTEILLKAAQNTIQSINNIKDIAKGFSTNMLQPKLQNTSEICSKTVEIKI